MYIHLVNPINIKNNPFSFALEGYEVIILDLDIVRFYKTNKETQKYFAYRIKTSNDNEKRDWVRMDKAYEHSMISFMDETKIGIITYDCYFNHSGIPLWTELNGGTLPLFVINSDKDIIPNELFKKITSKINKKDMSDYINGHYYYSDGSVASLKKEVDTENIWTYDLKDKNQFYIGVTSK